MMSCPFLAPCPLQEVLLYSTISGSLGGMLPLTAKEDSDFFRHLELFLRAEDDGNGCSLVGRDHVSYRSYFLPVKVSAHHT